MTTKPSEGGADAAIELSKVSGLIHTVAYGPIESRRLGNSMGINLLPRGMKICSFNCPYCECGWTDVGRSKRDLDTLPWPTPAEVEAELRAALDRCRAESFPIHHLTMAGNGEPTMHPHFGACVAAIQRVRDATYPDAKVAVLSNAMHLDNPEVVRVLDTLDERIMKIDGGTNETIRLIDVPLVPFDIGAIVERIAALRDNIVQTMFVTGRVDNTTDAEVAAWIELVRRAAPLHVQLYTIDRKAPDRTLQKAPRARLEEIADRLHRATGIEGNVFA